MVKWLILLFIFIVVLFLVNLLLTSIKVRKLYKGDSEMLYKVINNTKIAYVKKGQGFPLLLVHGFMASSYCFKGIIEDLSKNNTVYAVDVPGFGFSDKSLGVDYRRSSLANIVYEFMKSEGIKKFDLLGHSMGGEISIHMAINYPESINKLILVSSAGCQDIKVMPNWVVEIPKLCNFLIKNIFMTYYVQKISFEATVIDRKKYDKDIFYTIFSTSKLNMPPKTLRKLTEQSDDCNVLPKLRFIKNKTLIIWGEEDNVVPVKLAYKIRELMSDSKLVVMKNCKHNPYIEKPGEFLEILKGFIG